MQSICFLTNKYPNIVEPSALVFLQQLVWSMADMGIKCTVIAPMPTNIYPKYKQQPYHTVETTENGNTVEVYWPKYTGFGDEHKILGWSPAKLTTSLFTKAVKKTIEREEISFDAVYAHFLEPAGVAAARIGRKYGKPSFVAYGEATFTTANLYGTEALRKEFRDLSGVIAVATQNKEMLIERDLVSIDKIGVFPNGFRPERFYKRNREEARQKFGFDKGKFIVGFVGSFDNRKGVNRLSAAVDKCEDVYVAFAGKGSLQPTAKNTVWAQPVNNADLPWFYSAVDAFVLPTLNEGCCNAIIEALACGLPIISSNRRFNDDILDDTCSIRIDPESVDEICNAIMRIKTDSEFREKLANGSADMANNLTLRQRAENIISFINMRSMINARQ